MLRVLRRRGGAIGFMFGLRSIMGRQSRDPQFKLTKSVEKMMAQETPLTLYRQFTRFLATGGLAASISYAVYLALVSLTMATVPARALGFIVGSLVSFAGNRRYTFPERQAGPLAIMVHGALYSATLAFNVAMNELGLHILGGQSAFNLTAAFIFATACSSTANFIGLRQLVFRSDPQNAVSPARTQTS